MPKPKSRKATARKKNGPRAGLPHIPALYGLKRRRTFLPWRHAEERLKRSRNYWICTTRTHGRPHAMPVWGAWLDGALYFGTARSSCKARNLARHPTLAVHLESGDDVVIVEGEAAEVADKETIAKIDAAYRKKYKMPLLMIPGETVLYRVRPRVVLAWTESNFPNDATRWEFAARAKR